MAAKKPQNRAFFTGHSGPVHGTISGLEQAHAASSFSRVIRNIKPIQNKILYRISETK
jgi:hypothetical protein